MIKKCFVALCLAGCLAVGVSGGPSEQKRASNLSYDKQSAKISAMEIGLGTMAASAADHVGQALAKKHISWGLNSTRNVAGISVLVKDEARAIEIIKRDSVANTYGFAFAAPPVSDSRVPAERCDLIATVALLSAHRAVAALRSAGGKTRRPSHRRPGRGGHARAR